MKLEIIDDDDIGFARIAAGEVHHTEHRPPDILVDVDADGNALSIEVVNYASTPPEMIQAVFKEFRVPSEPTVEYAGALSHFQEMVWICQASGGELHATLGASTYSQQTGLARIVSVPPQRARRISA